MRLATIDLGTNTVLLLITQSDEAGTLRVLGDHHAIARVGEGVDKTRRISDSAYMRLIQTLSEHREKIDALEVEKVNIVATSAMRDAENRDDIISRVKGEFGYEIELLTGGDEAQWTYRGALLGLGLPEDQSIGVIDIGGGSTELSFGSLRRFVRGVSMEIGAVRVHERHMHNPPYSSDQVTSATTLVSAAIRSAAQQLVKPDRLVAVAGTPTSLSAMQQALTAFDRARIHGSELDLQQIEPMLGYLLSHSTDDLLAKYPVVDRSRADILPAGALILYSVMRLLQTHQVTVSIRGLRYGLAIREWERHFQKPSLQWQIVE